jgi:hypothetical protein
MVERGNSRRDRKMRRKNGESSGEDSYYDEDDYEFMDENNRKRREVDDEGLEDEYGYEGPSDFSLTGQIYLIYQRD